MFLFMIIIVTLFLKQHDAAKPDPDRDYIAIQYDQMKEEGTLMDYVRSTMNILGSAGFVCACARMREDNHNWHIRATNLYKTTHSKAKFKEAYCEDIWYYYLKNSDEEFIENLKNVYMGEDQDFHFYELAKSLCKSYDACSAHIHCNPDTVGVVDRTIKSQKGIVEILSFEKDDYLLMESDMEYINDFLSECGKKGYHFLQFNRAGRNYAIPQLINRADLFTCPKISRECTRKPIKNVYRKNIKAGKQRNGRRTLN